MGMVFLDQGSLFIAAGIGGAALALTLFSGWLHNRGDRFLMNWMAGLVMLSAGVVLYSVGPADSMGVVALAFGLEIAGFAAVFVGGRQFVGLRTPRAGLAALALMVPIVTLPILAGFDGAGLTIYNFLAAGLLIASAYHYWAARAEAPAIMVALALLYALTGTSFIACGTILLQEANWALGRHPDNWAEQFNAIMCIAGITGVGALSLSLTHARAARRHREEARTDALTGLLNRRALFAAMSEEPLRQGDAVIVFDLDRFKTINDRHGHAVGDEVLRRFAEALRQNGRPGDLAARTGGEEFVLVMQDASLQLAAATAERVRAMFAADRVETPNGRLSTTASAGVAISAGDAFEIVLHRADMSLYRAKDGGRDRVLTERQAVA